MRMHWRSGLALLVVIGLLGALAPTASIQAAPAADIEGNTYTSPTFGYSVTWDDTWFVAGEETSGGADYLYLVNGVTSAVFAGIPDVVSTEACVGYLASGIGLAGDITDFAPLVGDDGNVIRGEDDGHAYAVFSGTTTFDGGTPVELAIYLDCQAIVPGASLLSLAAFMPLEMLDGQLPLIQDLLADVVIPGTASEEPAEPGASDVPEEPGVVLDEELEQGEPAPVFVTQRWRVAVATTVRDEAIERAGLKPKPGKEWIVVVADVTNWSGDDANLTGDDLGLVFAGDDRRYDVAPNSSRAVARELGLETTELADGVALDPGETVRVSLVFQVPAEGEAPTLYGLTSETGLPLEDGRSEDDLQEIRPQAQPPVLQEVEVVEAIDGEVVELRIADEPTTVRARLIGVDAPAASDCYGDWAASRMTALVSETVWIEFDPTEQGGLTEKVYLWAENPSGLRVLVNERQIASGYAEPRTLDEDARFGAWIGEAGRTAQANENGLWGKCEREAPSVTATTEATSTELAESLPDEVTIEAFDLGYRPERVTIPADTDVTLTITNSGASEHTFSIDELDVNIAVPPGETETFAINVSAGDYVFFCEQPGHRTAGMEGVLHAE